MYWFNLQREALFPSSGGHLKVTSTSRTQYANHQQLPHLLSTYNVARAVLDVQGTEI